MPAQLRSLQVDGDRLLLEGAPVPAVHRAEIPLEFRQGGLPVAQRGAAGGGHDSVARTRGGSVGDAGHGERALLSARPGAPCRRAAVVVMWQDPPI
jgi:hypothetical protein